MEESKKRRSFCEWVKYQHQLTKILLRAIPSILVAIFVLAVVVMNLMANKVILYVDWIALNGGILVSWIPFLIMDITTKHFGAKAANKLSYIAIVSNLFCCLIFYIVSLIGVNEAFDSIFRGTWFILVGSTIAFILSAITNNYSNEWVGKLFKKNPNGKLAYITRTYISTFLGQVIDNLAFVIPTYMLFAPIFWGQEFGWTFVQCLTCSVFCAVLEFVLEGIFSPLGYLINKRWQKENLGEEYFKFLEENER